MWRVCDCRFSSDFRCHSGRPGSRNWFQLHRVVLNWSYGWVNNSVILDSEEVENWFNLAVLPCGGALWPKPYVDTPLVIPKERTERERMTYDSCSPRHRHAAFLKLNTLYISVFELLVHPIEKKQRKPKRINLTRPLGNSSTNTISQFHFPQLLQRDIGRRRKPGIYVSKWLDIVDGGRGHGHTRSCGHNGILLSFYRRVQSPKRPFHRTCIWHCGVVSCLFALVWEGERKGGWYIQRLYIRVIFFIVLGTVVVDIERL